MSWRLLPGDCRKVMLSPEARGPFDMVLADPPYGDTSLAWDKRVDGWLQVARSIMKPNGSMWVFGSMRFFINQGHQFRDAGFRLAQDIVWEKHNGSGLHNVEPSRRDQ